MSPRPKLLIIFVLFSITRVAASSQMARWVRVLRDEVRRPQEAKAPWSRANAASAVLRSSEA